MRALCEHCESICSEKNAYRAGGAWVRECALGAESFSDSNQEINFGFVHVEH